MDYQSNSKKSAAKKAAPEKKAVEKVVTEEVVSRKKPLGRRFKGLFFGGEFKSATHYIALEVLLPAFRNLIVDASTKGIERMVYGESSFRRSPRAVDGRSRVSYHNPSMMRPDPRNDPRLPNQPPRPTQQRAEQNEIVLHTRADAETVLERLVDILDAYEVASVADLHDLVGLPTNPIDNKWGWTYLSSANIRQIREGFVIELPPAEPI